MQPLNTYAKFCYDHLLTPLQQRAFDGLDKDLQDYMAHRFFDSKLPESFTTIGILFDIIKSSRCIEYKEKRDQILLEILKYFSRDVDVYLNKLKTIFKK